MSNTPPVKRSPTGDPAAGDGVELTVNEARGGERSGRIIWVLAISVIAAAVLLLGYLGLHAHHMQAIQQTSGKSGRQDLNAQDISTYAAPEPAPRQRPPETATTSNSAS